jgi:hypothetical protein
MTVSVSADDLRLIFPNDQPDAVLAIHIAAAVDLVTTELAGSGLTSTRLNSIALYLSAHLLALTVPLAKSETLNGYRYDIQGEFETGLKATAFGQAALALDTSGKLADLSLKPIIFDVLARRDNE